MTGPQPFVRYKTRLDGAGPREVEDGALDAIIQGLPRGEAMPFLRALALLGFHKVRKEEARAEARAEGGKVDEAD